MARVLNVPYFPQTDDGYCLPACVQMVLGYLGFHSTQDQLACELDVRPFLGTPASNVTRLRSQGRGHTAVIHTQNQELIEQFGREVEASRILVNTPNSQRCIGLSTGLTPSPALGCGTFGGNSTTDNVTLLIC